MVWSPKENVVDTTVLIDNWIEFVKANQESAFLWANPNVGLKNFETVFNSAVGRVIEVFPSHCVTRDRMETPYGKDILIGNWFVETETAIENDLPEQATIEARKYRDAIESMMLNIKDELAANSRIKTYAELLRAQTEFDVIATNAKGKHIQVFTTVAEFRIETESQ